MDNPFDRYGLDPRAGVEAITQRLKELAEDATTEVEREELRQAWETLTLHPAERARAALFAYPSTARSGGAPPPRKRSAARQSVDLRELAQRPSASSRASAVTSSAAESEPTDSVPSLDADPLLDR